MPPVVLVSRDGAHDLLLCGRELGVIHIHDVEVRLLIACRSHMLMLATHVAPLMSSRDVAQVTDGADARVGGEVYELLDIGEVDQVLGPEEYAVVGRVYAPLLEHVAAFPYLGVADALLLAGRGGPTRLL